MNKAHPQSKNELRLVAWEMTRSCNLNCVHCRAAAERGPYPGELDTEKCLEILDQMHTSFHDRALIHVRVHFQSGLTCLSARRWSGALFHFFVIIFAVPASLIQRYLGISRKLD